MIGETVGSYRIVAKISSGGMGTVYRAEHVLIGRSAAVKVLNPELCADEDAVKRFLNEAKATTLIKHPGIVEVFDFGHMESGEAYLTMEYLDGMPLSRRLKMRGAMREGEAAMLLRGVCSALAAAHAKGIVHRDLKPDNIFLVADPESATGERPKLLDFGIAKLTDIGLAGATRTGAVMGTPTYMSPEQCRGSGEVDHRADLYSLGCIFYEMVATRPPFVGLGAGELIGAHLLLEPDPPSQHAPGLTKETEALILALIEKDPAKRPQTVRELSQLLTEVAQRTHWITQTSPTGVTVQTAPAPPPRPDPIVPGTAETLPSKPPGADTPATNTPPVFLDKPTTLSGAASSILETPRRSRRPLGIAMAVSAFLAGGTVAFFQLHKSSDDAKPAPTEPTRPATTPEPPPTPDPPATANPGATTPSSSTATANPGATTPSTATSSPTATASSTATANPGATTSKPTATASSAVAVKAAGKPVDVAVGEKAAGKAIAPAGKPAKLPVKGSGPGSVTAGQKPPKKNTLIETDL